MKFLRLVTWSLALLSPSLAQVTPLPALTYDVVSIKPNKSGSGSVRVSIDRERFLGTNVSVKALIRYAYDLETEDLIFGLPGWAGSSNLDVEAKVSAEDVAALKKLSNDESTAQRRLMMQALLADRFALKIHHENKELPTYALVVLKSGLRIKTADPNNTYEDGLKSRGGVVRGPGSVDTSNTQLTAQAAPMSSLGSFLAQKLHRPVDDKTGLTANYDFTLKWSPDEIAQNSQDANTPPSIYTALQEQLGLKLESTKGPVDTIVVDHIDPPTEN